MFTMISERSDNEEEAIATEQREVTESSATTAHPFPTRNLELRINHLSNIGSESKAQPIRGISLSDTISEKHNINVD